MPSRKAVLSQEKQDALSRAQRLLRRDERDLVWYHGFGTCVALLYPPGERTYAASTVKELAAKLKLKAESAPELLWCARKFAALYTAAEVAQIAKRSREKGSELAWKHMQALMSVKDRQLRRALTSACIQGQWSVSHLRRKIQEKKGFPKEGGGRIDRPQTLDEAVQQFMQESRAWLRRCRKVWFGEADATTSGELPVFKAKLKIEDHGNIVDLIDKAITDANAVRQWAASAKRELEQLRTSVAAKARR
jgi:hypothetical protein